MNVTEVADRLLADLAPLDARAAGAVGRPPEVVVPDASPAAWDARREVHAAARRRLAAAEAPTRADRRLALVLAERLDAEVALDDCGFTRSLVAPLATPAHQIREAFDDLAGDDPDRLGANLDAVPAALAGWAATLAASLDAGRVAPARIVAAMAAQCARWVDPAGDDFYARLAADRPALARGASLATAATQEFVAFLRTTLLPRARTTVAAGRDVYSVTARAFLGEDVDLDETYAWGWEELAALSAEMRQVAAALGHGSVEEAAAALDADPARTVRDPARLLAWLQGRVGEVTAAVDGVHFDLPAGVDPVECRLAAATSGVMYYTAPDPDFRRPGRIWWSPPAGPSHTWRELTTVLHEGVPGHHLQTVVAMRAPGLHPWQRMLAHVHGHVEGWAHYAERLAGEIGLLADPGDRLGMLFGQRWRAARVVIDLGLHLDLPIPAGNGLTDASRWTPEVGVAVLRAASGADEGAAAVEVDRYLGWPGQALAFRVGARSWEAIRLEAGARRPFDRRAFHMRLLRLGTMGLGPLRSIAAEELDGRG